MSKYTIFKCDRCGAEIEGPITNKIRIEQMEKTCNLPVGEIKGEFGQKDFCMNCIDVIMAGLEERNCMEQPREVQKQEDTKEEKAESDITEELEQSGKYPAKKKNRNRKLTDDQYSKVVKYYESGMSVQEVANKLGADYNNIYDYLKSVGVYKSKREPSRNAADPDVETVKRLYFAENKNIVQVSKELKTSTEAVRRVIVNNNLTKNTKEYQKYMATCSREEG